MSAVTFPATISRTSICFALRCTKNVAHQASHGAQEAALHNNTHASLTPPPPPPPPRPSLQIIASASAPAPSSTSASASILQPSLLPAAPQSSSVNSSPQVAASVQGYSPVVAPQPATGAPVPSYSAIDAQDQYGRWAMPALLTLRDCCRSPWLWRVVVAVVGCILPPCFS